jgi:hypothetical protein
MYAKKIEDGTFRSGGFLMPIAVFHHVHPGRLYGLPFVLLIILTVLACTTKPGPASNAPFSLERLHAFCGLPASCNAPVPWQGQTVTVQAFIDADNIFDKRHYPRLPYEKFRLFDRQGRALEVWAQAADNHVIFDKLANRPADLVAVSGRLAAVRLPIANQCRMGVKVLIDDASQVTFK